MINRAVTSFLLVSVFLFTGCPQNDEDAVMFHIYHTLHPEISQATDGTEIPPEYLAALISLESHPPGNRDSQRFEPAIYERLRDLKYTARPFARIDRADIRTLSDEQLRRLATSYGLTQIMGYHCLTLGCSIDDLSGPYHLNWAIAYMREHYGRQLRKKEWEAAFRIHNTGHPQGKTSRRDYAERGLARMEYYRNWMKREGNPIGSLSGD